MTDKPETRQLDTTGEEQVPERVVRATGLTESERYLQRLCERSFLTLWSYPGVFRDQGGAGREGKEITDLLVVFEEHVIIFSDKDIRFPDTGNLATDWTRWHKKAVLSGAAQVWGAERWLRQFRTRVFLDRKCTQRFPYALPDSIRAKYHRVVVAHGASERCRTELGGSGSLMLTSDPDQPADTPFMIGDLDPEKGYVHVLDDTSLDVVLETCDTITDFVRYLSKKEELIRSGIFVSAAGEEELLAHYLKRTGTDGNHDFSLSEDITAVALLEGEYEEYVSNPQYLRKRDADQISYAWDNLIELFAGNVLGGTLVQPTDPHIATHESGLRLLAREPRVRRRMLATAFVEMLETQREKLRAARVIEPSGPGDPFYVFLALAQPAEMSYDDYRAVRRQLLFEYCRVVRLLRASADTVVGIATEFPGVSRSSEDLIVYDGMAFDASERDEAKRAQRELGIFRQVARWANTEKEYPDEQRSAPTPLPIKGGRYPGTSRNAPCPCGRGLKYKKCCGP